MKTDKGRISWTKWLIATIIAIVGAGGGIVALLKYNDDREQAADQEYRNAVEEWEEFTPESLSLTPQQMDFKVGECVDLDLGRIVDLTNVKGDVCYHRWPDDNIYALSTKENIEVAELGKVSFSDIRYRTLIEAPFVRPEKYGDILPILFRSNKSQRPPVGFVYVLKLPTHHVAKVQIVKYDTKPLEGLASMQWPYVRIQYEVFPIVGIPPRPKRADF